MTSTQVTISGSQDLDATQVIADSELPATQQILADPDLPEWEDDEDENFIGLHFEDTMAILGDYDDDFAEEDIQLTPDPPHSMNGPSAEVVRKFGKVTVRFPFEPYKSQIDIMELIVKGVDSSQNCLLESPTGTGKTKAVLVPLVAWQSHWRENYYKSRAVSYRSQEDQKKGPVNGTETVPSPVKKLKSDGNIAEEHTEEMNIPIIYFATRTHSQIEQAAKQFGQTAYGRSVPMSILASRKQVCLNEQARASNVDQECNTFRNNMAKNKKKLTDKPVCKFYQGSVQVSSFCGAHPGSFDLEDLQAFGRDTCCCPFYELKAIQKKAQIVFCTYQHLLHKRIRQASQVDLEGSIVVFDEAHNIEDVCRDIASSNSCLKSDVVQSIVIKLEEAYGRTEIPSIKIQPLQNLALAFKRLDNWFAKQLKRNAPNYIEVYSENTTIHKFKRVIGDSLIEEMTNIQFCTDDIRKIWSDFMILEDRHYTIKTSEEDWGFKVDPDTMHNISQLLHCLSFLFKKDPVTQQFVNFHDYAKFLIKTRRKVWPKPNSQGNAMIIQGTSSQPDPDKDVDDHAELYLLCLNPAIVFKEMKDARTIIVTSGTLSPTNSFATELNTEFPIILEAAHVMGPDRIFSCIINSNTDSNMKLRFSADHLNKDSTYENHQKQLFDIISRLCDHIQHGILVFVPSSSFIKRLKTFWCQNGNLERLRKKKDLFFEHENRIPDDFKTMMKDYRKVVEEPRGAILFAVLRGKISEGVDFRDNQARAVITIGIPFGPCKDDAILAKKSYNTMKKKHNPKYLDGSQWYEASAFRALNQAFGRCVRHVKDWGAIFIVESRFSDIFRYRNSLSKWVQQSLGVQGRRTSGSLDTVLPDLNKFLGNLAAADQN